MPPEELRVIRLDPARKAMERQLAELEARLASPPESEATESALAYHIHHLFCGWSAFLRKGEEQEEIEEPVVEVVRGVPLWAIEKAVAALHRPPATKYPPSASAFRAACDVELVPVRSEAWRLRQELDEMDRPPIDPAVTARRIEAEREALREKRKRLGDLLKGLSAELRLSDAAHDLSDTRARAERGDVLPRAPLPVAPEPEPAPDGRAQRPDSGDGRTAQRIAS